MVFLSCGFLRLSFNLRVQKIDHGVSRYYQTVVKGLVLLVAVLFDVVMQMRRKGAQKKKKAEATQASAEKGGAEA